MSSLRSSRPAAALTRLAACVLRGQGDPPALLEEMRQMFGLDAVSLLGQRMTGSELSWYVLASAGEQPPEEPGADVELPVSDTFTLAARGRVPGRDDMRVLFSCAAQVAAGVSCRRQGEREAEAGQLAASLRSRDALLAATGESARQQLAAATAALTALAEGGPGDRAALIAAARRAGPGTLVPGPGDTDTCPGQPGVQAQEQGPREAALT